MFTYPHTIDNGHGERLTFLGRVQTSSGEALEVENVVSPGAGPPMHVHYRQEEGLTVLEGLIGYQRKGEPVQYAGVGESVVFRAGEIHRFWNAGETDLRCKGYVTPPGSFETFLKGIYEAQKKSRSLRPDPMEAAYLIRRYGSEFGMDEIPPFVQRFIFPVMVTIGHLTGKFRKFQDAPPSVRSK